MRALAETNGKDSMRGGAKPRVPKPDSQHGDNNRACGGCDEDGLAPGSRFLDVTLAFEDRNFDALGFGLGFAEWRANVAEEFHALGANGLGTNVTFFHRELPHVPEAGFRRV